MSLEHVQQNENEYKTEQLIEVTKRLAEAIELACTADIQLDFADMLRAQAAELESSYSTVKFRHTGIPGGEPGRVNKEG